jgi:hypothetical protein
MFDRYMRLRLSRQGCKATAIDFMIADRLVPPAILGIDCLKALEACIDFSLAEPPDSDNQDGRDDGNISLLSVGVEDASGDVNPEDIKNTVDEPKQINQDNSAFKDNVLITSELHAADLNCGSRSKKLEAGVPVVRVDDVAKKPDVLIVKSVLPDQATVEIVNRSGDIQLEKCVNLRRYWGGIC